MVDAFDDAVGLWIFYRQWARKNAIAGKELGKFGAELGPVIEDDGVRLRILGKPFLVKE